MYQLMTYAIIDGQRHGIGTLPYVQVPRIGEWVDLINDDKQSIHEVIMVIYGTVEGQDSAGELCEIYVKHLGSRSSVLQTLCP